VLLWKNPSTWTLFGLLLPGQIHLLHAKRFPCFDIDHSWHDAIRSVFEHLFINAASHLLGHGEGGVA